MKPIFLFILIIISGEIFSQTIIKRDTIRVGDSAVVVVTSKVVNTRNVSVPFTYKDTTTTVTKTKIYLGTNPTPNQSPTANAGQDVSVLLPINSVNLSGIGTDVDGNIVGFLWEKVSGGTAIIASPTTATTSINNLLSGSYTFKLTVTDNDGATATDNVNVIVSSIPPPVDTSGMEIEGFGVNVSGGAGKTVVHVTTASALQSAIASNRIIVFDGATINASFRGAYSNITNLTIDGTTGNVTLTNDNNGDLMEFENSSNVIIKNIRFRGAGNGAGNDVFALNNNCKDFVIDHCSFSNGKDGNLDLTESSNISVQFCIIGSGGNNGTSDKWSGASLVAYSPGKNISIHHNLYTAVTQNGVAERIPLISHNFSLCDFRNNLVWRWGRATGTGSGYATGVSDGGTANVVNNYYYSTAAQTSATVNKADPSLPAGSMYAAGNFSGNGVNANGGNNHAEYPVPLANQIKMQAPCDAARKILAKAGCQPLDAIDRAYINSVTLPLCQ